MRTMIVLIIASLFFLVSCDPGESKYNPEESKLKTKSAKTEFGKAFSIFKEKTKSSEAECNEDGDCDEGNEIDSPDDLNDIDFTTSYNLFNEAVKADPNNLDAQLGAAVTRILSLLKDPEFMKLRDAWWDISDFNLSDSALNKSRFKISNFINNALVPAIDYSLARIEAIDKPENKDYVFMVTPDIYGEEDGDTFELDMGEIKEFHAFLLALKGGADMLQAYKIDLDSYTLEAIKNALTKGSDFLTLISQAKMSDAYDKFLAAVKKGIEGINFILTEDDDQDDDILRNSGEFRNNLLDFKDNLTEVKKMLTQNYDLKHNSMTVTMTLKNFFHNSPQDLKALVPDYTVTINDDMIKIEFTQDEVDFEFPDTTFGNFFAPTPTQDEIKFLFGIYECNDNNPCYDGDPYYHCTEDYQCEYGMACANDEGCEEWEHCGDDGYCKDGKRCSEQSDCGSWEHCSSEGYCEYGSVCETNDDCDSWSHCSGEGYCEDGKVCSSDSDCYEDEFCNADNYCEYE